MKKKNMTWHNTLTNALNKCVISHYNTYQKLTCMNIVMKMHYRYTNYCIHEKITKSFITKKDIFLWNTKDDICNQSDGFTEFLEVFQIFLSFYNSQKFPKYYHTLTKHLIWFIQSYEIFTISSVIAFLKRVLKVSYKKITTHYSCKII